MESYTSFYQFAMKNKKYNLFTIFPAVSSENGSKRIIEIYKNLEVE